MTEQRKNEGEEGGNETREDKRETQREKKEERKEENRGAEKRREKNGIIDDVKSPDKQSRDAESEATQNPSRALLKSGPQTQRKK